MFSSFWTFLFLCVICGTICRIMAINVKKRESRGYGSEDTRIIQEIHRDLQRMDERVEALETLLMERVRKQSVYSDLD